MCHFDFHNMFRLLFCLYREGTIHKFSGLSCWVILSLGSRILKDLVTYRSTLCPFTVTVAGQVQTRVGRRLLRPHSPLDIELPWRTSSLLLKQSYQFRQGSTVQERLPCETRHSSAPALTNQHEVCVCDGSIPPDEGQERNQTTTINIPGNLWQTCVIHF